MTTSTSPHKAPPGWIEPESGDSAMDTKELEIGISGINLSSFSGNRPPTLSGSSVSTAADETHSRQHSFGSFNGNIDIHRGTPPSPETPIHRGQSMPSFGSQSRPPGLGGPFPSPIGKSGSGNSTVASSPHLTLTPSSSVDGNAEFLSAARQTSPSGSTGQSYPDQLAEAGSSLHRGGSPWSEPSVHASAPNEGASVDTSEHQSAFSCPADNEDFDLDRDDGLRGLGALRERAHSSPGPLMNAGGFGGAHFSTSPPVLTESSSLRLSGSPLHMESGVFRDDVNRTFPSDPRRSRTPVRDGQGKAVSRPPRAGTVSTSHSTFSEGNMSFLSNQSQDMSRPDWSDGSGRGRSLSMGTMNTREVLNMQQETDFRANENYRIQTHIDQQHSQKFGSLSSLGSHVHHQRLPQSLQQQFCGMQHQSGGHVRSFSQPGPNPTGYRDPHELHGGQHVFDHALEYSPQRGEPQFFDEGESLHSGHVRGGGRYTQQILPAQLSRSVSAGNSLPHMQGVQQRSPSMGQHSLSSGAFDEVQQRRNSYAGSTQYLSHGGHSHPNLQRRDALDFMDPRSSGQPRSEPRPVMATREELKMFGIYSSSERGYGGPSSGRHERMPQSIHNRHHSDGGGVLSSAMSHGSRSMRGEMSHGHRLDTRSGGIVHGSSQYGPSPFEDDLVHPLAGEYIDDPDDDLGPPHEIPGVYGHNDAVPSHNSRHSFSSTTQLENLPTAGMSRSYSVDAHHRSSLPGPRVVYSIKFKRTQRSFVAGPRINRDLDIGCYVKVEADRGEDLGIVVGKMPAEKFNASAGRASFRPGGGSPGNDMGTPGMSPTCAADLKRVIRLATHDEVNLLAVKREEEDELLKICRTKVRQRALPMNVVDAEYQFDRHKLTFFFEAEGRVDFRELVRDLFSMYKTRIWMQQLDKNGSGSSASNAYASGSGGGVEQGVVDPPHDIQRAGSFQ